MPEPTAETAYLFRHAVLRDAAYELQLPAQREALHRVAFALLQQVAGGAPGKLQTLEAPDYTFHPHPSDPLARELALHAELSGELPEEHRLYLVRAAEHAERHLDIDNAVALWQSVGELETGAARAVALQRAAMTCARTGRPKLAEDLLDEAVRLAGEAGNERIRAGALARLAQVYDDTGRVEEAERTYEEALRLHQQVLDSRSGALTLGNLASLYFQTGRHELAEQTYRRVARMVRESGDRTQEGKTLGNLAGLYWVTGRTDLAQETIKQSLEIARETGDRHSEGIRIGNLASLQNGIGKRDEALENYSLALEIQREVSDRRGVGITLGEVAGIETSMGETEAAARHYREALAIHEQVHNRRYHAIHSCALAMCLLRTGEEVDARARFASGVNTLRELNDARMLTRSMDSMKETCGELGIPELSTGGEEAGTQE